MASINMAEQLDKQPSAKKPRIDNSQEQEVIENASEAGLPKSTDEIMEHKESGTSTTIVDLHSSRVPLPLELNCEIFKCLTLPNQRKFIWGLGRDIYGIFGHKLLKKTKKVRNPAGNLWDRTNTRATIAVDGLNVRNEVAYTNVFAEQPFPLSGPLCRMDEFPGTICYYFEVKGHTWFYMGLSDGAIPDHSWIGRYPNAYSIFTSPFLDECWLAGERHHFELPEGAIRPKLLRNNICGCGLVLDPEDKLWIFFTLNSKLLGRKIQINPTADRLFPAVSMPDKSSAEANFGNDPAKPFKYDIQNCPGLGLACI